MNAADVAATALGNLGRRKGRTALTAAGVVIGVGALVLMLSLGLGLERIVLGLFETDHSLRTLLVSRVRKQKDGERRSGGFPFNLAGQILPVTEEDVETLSEVEGVAFAIPTLDMVMRVSHEGGEGVPDKVGALHPGEEARLEGILVAGRMWKPGERACLVPESSLFAEWVGGTVLLEPLLQPDEEVSEEDLRFTVAGAFDDRKLGLLGRKVLLPLDAAAELRRTVKGGIGPFGYKEGAYPGIEVRTTEARSAGEVSARIRNLGYDVQSVTDIVGVIDVVFLVFEGFLASIGAVGLIVSLFGIANTMAMALLERTREIGIMKALGARNRDILALFLAECAAIGALGGVVGLLLALGGGAAMNALTRAAFDLDPELRLFHVPLWLAAGSVGFAMAVSMLAGAIPARRAANMEPVSALRVH